MNDGNQVRRGSIFSRVMVALLITALAIGMTPLLPQGTAYAEDQDIATALKIEKPEIVVTGTGIIKDSTYTADNISNEVAYTIDELKVLAGKDNRHLYSALNTYGTRSIYLEEGVKIDTLLNQSKVTNLDQEMTFAASDNATVKFDPAKKTFGTPADRENASISQSLGKERYFYPNAAKDTDQEAEKAPVPAVISWAEDGGKGEVTIPTDVKDLGYVKVAAGQLGLDDYNNPLFNKYTQAVYVGDKVKGPVINIRWKNYTREEILLMGRADRTFTSTNKEGVTTTEYVRGVPVSELLKDCDKNAIVRFDTADNYSVSADGMTVKELIADNCILAYASGTNASDLEGIYTEKGGATGYFTLYGDTMKQAKMINRISIKGEPPMKAPVAKATAGVNSAVISWTGSPEAHGYEILKATNESNVIAYKSVKKTNAAARKYTITGLTAEKTYYLQVAAYKVEGGSTLCVYSNEIKVTPKLGATTLKVKAGSKKASLSWKKVKDAAGYKVYRATSKNGKYATAKTITKGSTVSYTNTGLKKGKTYYFKVRAYKKVGSTTKYGGYSSVKSVKVK